MTKKKEENKTKKTKNMSALKLLREAAGLTQSGLAKLIPKKEGQGNLTRQAISNWERGIDKPELTIRQMKALCKALGKSIDEIPDYFGPGPIQYPQETGANNETLD